MGATRARGPRLTGPATLAHIDSILGILADAGFSLELAHHALHVLGSRIYGFEQDMLGDSGGGAAPEADPAQLQAMLARYPNVASLARRRATAARSARATTTSSSPSGSTSSSTASRRAWTG